MQVATAAQDRRLLCSVCMLRRSRYRTLHRAPVQHRAHLFRRVFFSPVTQYAKLDTRTMFEVTCLPSQQPAHMQQPQQQHLHASHPSHSPVNHRPPSMPTHHHQQTHHLSNFSHSANHYGSVKVEDENYTVSGTVISAQLCLR